MHFMDAGMILVFITFGKLLEAKAKGRASEAIRGLLDLTPPEATVLAAGQPRQVPVSQVDVGQTILVRPGQRVPLDVRVVSGQAAVDQSWLTGESLPVEKSPGDEIFAGTLNGQGALTAEVTRAADRTAVAQVIELVRHAQESKTGGATSGRSRGGVLCASRAAVGRGHSVGLGNLCRAMGGRTVGRHFGAGGRLSLRVGSGNTNRPSSSPAVAEPPAAF